MNDIENIKKNQWIKYFKNKKIMVLLLIFLLAILIVGTSFALWQITLTQTGNNKIATGCLNMTLTDKNNITLDNAYPITYDEAMLLTPYTFTIENTCSANIDYYINLEDITSATKKLDKMYLNLYFQKEKLVLLEDNTVDDLTEDDLVLKNAIGGKRLYEGSLAPFGKATFDLRIWMDENTPVIDEVMNASYESKITIKGVYSAINLTDNILYSHDDKLFVTPDEIGEEYKTNSIYVRGLNNDSYLGKLKKIIFESTKNPYNDAEEIVDFSQVQNGSILGYYVKDSDGKYILHIQADGKIKINPEYPQYALFADETTNVTFEGLENIDNESLTDMSYMFGELLHLTNLDLSKLDTSNVTNMDGMFFGCQKIIATINIMNPNVSYEMIFDSAAIDEGSKIVINYTNETESLVDQIIESYIDSESNIVKGALIK